MAFFTRNEERISLFEAFLNQWRILLSSESAKGFEKFAKPPKTSEVDESKQSKTDEPAKLPPTSPSKTSSDTSKPPPDWNFGMFGPNPTAGPKGSNQGQGRPIGGEQQPDQTKMLLFGALGFIAFVSALTYFEMGYKEISWKDFVNK